MFSLFGLMKRNDNVIFRILVMQRNKLKFTSGMGQLSRMLWMMLSKML